MAGEYHSLKKQQLHIPAAQGHLHGVLGPVSRTFKATLTDF